MQVVVVIEYNCKEDSKFNQVHALTAVRNKIYIDEVREGG